jgi:hypothetical protein
MEQPLVIGTMKEFGNRKRQVAVIANTINTTNRLDALVGNTLTGMTNGQHLYYQSGTAINKRNMSILGVVFTDINALAGTGNTNRLGYSSTTSKWSNLTKNTATYYNFSTSSPLLAGMNILNAGNELSLFGYQYWTGDPQFQYGSGFSYDSVNRYFTTTSPIGTKILITLHIKMAFASLPATSYFIFRIGDGTTNFLTTRVYNTGSADDIYKTHTITYVATNTLGIFNFTAGYVGSAISRFASAMGNDRGTRVVFKEIT